MTTVLEPASDTATTFGWRHRRLVVVVALVVIAVVGSGIGVLVHRNDYRHSYQPLEPGNVGGGPIGAAKALTDGVTDPTGFILTGKPGSIGGEMRSIANGGSHAVTIFGFPRNSEIQVTWLPYRVTDTSLTHRLFHSRRFPMTLQPRDEIQIFITMTQPRNCRPSDEETIDSLSLDTESFGVHHQYALDARGSEGFLPITSCPPKAAFRHLSKFF